MCKATATHQSILAEERSAIHAIILRFADVYATESAFHIELQRVRSEDKEIVKRFLGKTGELEAFRVVGKFWNVRRA